MRPDLFSHPSLHRARDLELGVSTSAFQSEGALDIPGHPQSNWSEAQRDGRLDPIGEGTRLWHRFDEAVARCADLGLRRMRLTLEWTRLRPDGAHLRPEALRGYAERVISLRSKGIEPIVTLHHFAHPRALGEDFWLDDHAHVRFADHCAEVMAALDGALLRRGSPCVDRVITINEPNMYALATWVAGVFPHRARSLADGSPLGLLRAWRCLDAMLAGHILATRRIHAGRIARGLPRAELSANVNLLDLHSLGAGIFDLLRAPSEGVPPRGLTEWLDARRARWHAHLFAGERDAPRAVFARSLDGFAARSLPLATLTRTLDALRRDEPPPLDALAVDLYDPYSAHQVRPPSLVRAFASADPDALAAAVRAGLRLAEPWEWSPAPAALPRMIRALGEGMRPLPVDVIECGMCVRRDPGSPSAEPRADGLTRAGFLRQMLRGAIETLVVQELPLRTWLYWTLVDNYELGRWSPRFGLWSLDDAGGWGTRDAAGDAAAEVLGACARALAQDPIDRVGLRCALADGA